MTNDNNRQDMRWITHVRAVVHDVTTMPSPEVRAIARVDMFVNAKSVVRHLPVVRCFATVVDEHDSGLLPCTPVSLASIVWLPRPPAILIGYDGAVWDWFTPAFRRGVARVDLSKVARFIWPEGPTYDLLKMADYLISGGPPRVREGSTADRLTSQVQAVADIFTAALLDRSVELTDLAGAPVRKKAPGLGNILGNMAGDPRLATMIEMSTAPMPPLTTVPAPWDDAEAWFNLAGEDLAWIIADQSAASYERDAAGVEVARRKNRNEAQLQPRPLLRSRDAVD